MTPLLHEVDRYVFAAQAALNEWLDLKSLACHCRCQQLNICPHEKCAHGLRAESACSTNLATAQSMSRLEYLLCACASRPMLRPHRHVYQVLTSRLLYVQNERGFWNALSDIWVFNW